MKRDMGAIRMGIRAEWLDRERERCARIPGVFIVREPIGGCPKARMGQIIKWLR